MRIKYTILLTFAFLLLTLGTAHAVNFTADGNPDDTLAGTVIVAPATQETLDYTDVNDNPKPRVNPVGDIQVTVLPIYGFSVGYSFPKAIPYLSMDYGYKGQTRYIYYGITNEGNASDNYTITSEAVFSGAGSGTWTVQIWRDNSPFGTAEGSDVLIGTLTPGSPSTKEIVSVAEDATYFFYWKIIYPNANAKNGDILGCNYNYKTSSTPVGSYQGANGLYYGGMGEDSGGVNCRVAMPEMIINARDSYVDAPKSPYVGGATTAVPGTIISYRTTYSNAGLCSAEGMIFVDRVPNYTNLAHFNKTGNTDNVTLTTDLAKKTGNWTIWYSTQANPQKTYNDSTGWTLVGTLDATASNYFPAGTATYQSSDGAFNALWIKWEKPYIASTEDDKAVTWGVTIR